MNMLLNTSIGNTQVSIKQRSKGQEAHVTESTQTYKYRYESFISRNSPLDDLSPALGLKAMDPETQTLQEHGCRTPV